MKRDNLYFGLFIGFIAPLLSYLLVIANLIATEKNLAFLAVAGLVNLLLMRYFYHFELSKSAQGVIVSTFISLLFLLFLGNLHLET